MKNVLGVVGAGQMGTGIAIVAAARAQRNVMLLDKFPQSLQNSKKFVQDWIEKEISKGRLDEGEAASMTSHMIFHQLLTDAEGTESRPDSETQALLGMCSTVIEAVSEDFRLKEEIFKSLLAPYTPPECILASNTSSISITKLAATVDSEASSRVIGMHFMNPVPVMPLVEVIQGLQTSETTYKKTMDLCTELGKVAGTSKDRPGFIANRILMPYINEAIMCVQDGISSKEDVDKIMKMGTGVPMGPLTLADFIGLDTCLAIMRILHQDLGEAKYRPAPLLVNYVEAGWLGKKNRKGVLRLFASRGGQARRRVYSMRRRGKPTNV